MADEQLFKVWSGVPDGSKLIVIVEGTTGTAFLVATMRGFVRPPPEGEEIEPVIIDAANGTPFEFEVESPNRYSLSIELVYMKDATAKVHAHIEDADGNQFKEPLDTEITRPNGRIERVALTIGTATAVKAKKAKKATMPKKARKKARGAK